MAVFEQLGRMTYVDAIGDQHILYPVTKKECVDGLSDSMSAIDKKIGDISKLETTDKSNIVAAINEARQSGNSDITNIQNAINEILEAAKQNGDFDGRGIVSIVRTAGNGSAGSVDTYTITYTDNTTSTFNVYNGANGVGDASGETGENGATFIPSLDSSGNLSWSNDRWLPNPETINIMGKDGKDGYTPQKGIDYFDGSDGFSPTITTSEIDGGYEITISNKDNSKTISVLHGQDGVGKPGKDGMDGDDGVSCYHTWDGTTLSVTSASGTSSSDLIGPSGKDGVGILSVIQTTSSNESNGENVVTVTLSNNEAFTFTFRNGSIGETGRDGDSGKDATINGVNSLHITAGSGIVTTQNNDIMTISANYGYGTDDLIAGESALETGKLYFVYE